MKAMIGALALLVLTGCATAGVEEPAFSVVSADSDFEVRDYAAVITAETSVSGEPVEARYEGFMPLADYI
ncbi:MAG TPA: heme-binding protein, partial [Hyphomonadaceae bacterium]